MFYDLSGHSCISECLATDTMYWWNCVNEYLLYNSLFVAKMES